MTQGVCSNGPTPKLVQRVYNYIQIICEQHGMPMEEVEVAHVEEVLQNDPEDSESNIVCAKCLSGEIIDGNDILLCDGDHTSTIGYHQQWCVSSSPCP